MSAARAAALALVALGAAGAAFAEPREWVSPPGASRVGFLLHTFWHGVEGTTTAVSAKMTSESGDPLADGVVTAGVDAASLSTGIKRRDAKMREEHLESAAYPIIAFRSTSPPREALAGRTAAEGTSWVDVEGEFTLHGVTHPVTATVEAIREEAGWMMKSHFTLSLSDYGIADPSILLNKVDDAVDIYFEIKLAATP